jgi:hypothetical protein
MKSLKYNGLNLDRRLVAWRTVARRHGGADPGPDETFYL